MITANFQRSYTTKRKETSITYWYLSFFDRLIQLEGKPPKKQKVEEKLQLAKPAPKNERAGSAEGQIVPLVSNFFPMNFSISNKYDEYHVDFEVTTKKVFYNTNYLRSHEHRFRKCSD